uniref:hypothetical protein n=1 Tax=Thalassoroseus pseudoceratinae TaxID=2713176 RepID=UPI00142349FA|nr:hypothetical protein [Thalassoroseus pseudoceratinae]
MTCTHCDSRLAVHRTQNTRFTEVIDDLREQVAKLTKHKDIEALDREWEAERQSLMITGKHGHTHVPTKGGTVIGGVVISGFGVLWTIFAFGITSQIPVGFAKIFPLFGVIFVTAGIAMSIHAYRKAELYEQAERRYRQQRATLLSRLEGQE